MSPSPDAGSARKSFIVRVKKGEQIAHAVEPVGFKEAGIREVQDLEAWIVAKPEILGEPLLVLDDEYRDFEGAKDRLDVLCIDQPGNVVVVELKRTESAGHADLQAVRYAAMVQPIMLDRAAEILSRARQRKGEDLSPEAAKRKILEFMGEAEAEEDPQLSTEPRIVIASPGFAEQILTTADYLTKHGISVTCVSLSAYSLGDGHFVLVPRTEYPVRQLQNFQRELRVKEEAVRSASRPVVSKEDWEQRASKESMQVLDWLLKILSESGEPVQLHYARSYVRALDASGRTLPLWIHPEKDPLEVHVRFPDSERATYWKGKLEEAGMTAWVTGSDVVRCQLPFKDVERNYGIVKEMLRDASKVG